MSSSVKLRRVAAPVLYKSNERLQASCKTPFEQVLHTNPFLSKRIVKSKYRAESCVLAHVDLCPGVHVC